MKVNDANLELLAIKTVCDSDLRGVLLAKLSQEYFGTDTAKEIYGRVTALIQAGKSVPSTKVLMHDEALAEASRAWISNPSIQAIDKKDDLEPLIDNLSKYRKARILLGVITSSVDTLKQDDPNIDEVISSMSSALSHCHSGEVKDEMLHMSRIHAKDLMNEMDQELGSPISDAIPTGFKEFDRRTGGVRRKNIMAIASTPGGGKSAMALQMGLNQAMMGYNVCMVSFEMDVHENLYRTWSNLSKISHRDLNMKQLSDIQKKIVKSSYAEFLESLEGKFTIWTPSRELSMADIGVELAPYGYDIFYVDYIGLLKEMPNKAMWESLGIHARQSKIVANRLNAAGVILAQYDDEGNKIKYSKAITANAHFVWAWENSEQERESGIVKVKQLKARNAELYDFYLQRDMSIMKFFDYSGPPPIDPTSTPAPQGPKMPGLK